MPQYQWFRNGSRLTNGDKKIYTVSDGLLNLSLFYFGECNFYYSLRGKCLVSFQVSCASIEHQGTYWCHVYNEQDSKESMKAEIVIGKMPQ